MTRLGPIIVGTCLAALLAPALAATGSSGSTRTTSTTRPVPARTTPTATPAPHRATAPHAAPKPAAVAAPVSADQLRIPFVKDRPAVINMTRDGIHVTKYWFARAMRGGANPFKMGQGPAIVFDVENVGAAEKDFGIAVALFDASGRLVGAGTAHHSGKLDAGKTEEVKVIFQDVNADVHRAATAFMTLETGR